MSNLKSHTPKVELEIGSNPWENLGILLSISHWISKLTLGSVQLLSHVQIFATPWTAAYQASLSITNTQNLFRLMSIESVMLSSRLIFHPLLLLPSIFPSIRIFSSESVLFRWPKYWIFSFSINASNEYSGLISSRMNWFGYHCSARDSQESSPTPQFKAINFLSLIFLYCPTITSTYDYCINALTSRTFVGKVLSPLLNMLSRLVITFLPMSKCLLISWLH